MADAEKLFRKVLVAGRGAAAVRVLRACRELGVATVAVYAETDRDALHLRLADEACVIGPAPLARSYHHGAALIEAARHTGCDALHPGAGPLALQAAFAEQCAAAGLVFIGPRPDVLAAAANKLKMRALAASLGLPVLPGSPDEVTDDNLAAQGQALGWPLMIKPVAGHGGLGLRRVDKPDQLAALVRAARAELHNAGLPEGLYLERCLDAARLLEVQILGDRHGHRVHLLERDCSLQWRHRKLVHEAPAAGLPEGLRGRLTEAALRLADALAYDSAGTVEFLVDSASGAFHFLELNATLGDEYAATEAVTATDLCLETLRVAAGLPLRVRQADVRARRHAITCALRAADPDHNLVPTTGTITGLRLPGGAGVRNDIGVGAGQTITATSERQLGWLTLWADSRPACIARCQRALAETAVLGLKTTLPLVEGVLQSPAYLEGRHDTGFILQASPRPAAAGDGTLAQVAFVAAAIASLRSAQERASVTASGPRATAASSGWKLSGRFAR